MNSTHHVHRGAESLPCYCAATADHLIGEEASRGEALARRFHETYERLAPSFGYETRTETRKFDPTTPNGRLMIAVCSELYASPQPAAEVAPKYTTGHCANHNQPGGCQLHNLQCGWPSCDRRPK